MWAEGAFVYAQVCQRKCVTVRASFWAELLPPEAACVIVSFAALATTAIHERGKGEGRVKRGYGILTRYNVPAWLSGRFFLLSFRSFPCTIAIAVIVSVCEHSSYDRTH